jgi:hypothetical protein
MTEEHHIHISGISCNLLLSDSKSKIKNTRKISVIVSLAIYCKQFVKYDGADHFSTLGSPLCTHHIGCWMFHYILSQLFWDSHIYHMADIHPIHFGDKSQDGRHI